MPVKVGLKRVLLCDGRTASLLKCIQSTSPFITELIEPLISDLFPSFSTIAKMTPDQKGFLALKTESMASGFNLLRRLEENWLNGQNRFDKPEEKLFGFYADDSLIAVCGLNQDPYTSSVRAGRLRHLYVGIEWRKRQIGSALLSALLEGSNDWFNFINTNAPESAHAFYKRAGFIQITDTDKVTHRLYLNVVV